MFKPQQNQIAADIDTKEMLARNLMRRAGGQPHKNSKEMNRANLYSSGDRDLAGTAE